MIDLYYSAGADYQTLTPSEAHVAKPQLQLTFERGICVSLILISLLGSSLGGGNVMYFSEHGNVCNEE